MQRELQLLGFSPAVQQRRCAMIAIQQWVRGWLWRRRLWVICIRAAQRVAVVAGSAPDGGARVPRAARVQFAQVCLPSPPPPLPSLSLCLFASLHVCDCTCVIAHDCWQTILKQELWTAFYLNGEGWAIGDGMWTMSAVVWTDGDDSDDEIPYDTSSSDE